MAPQLDRTRVPLVALTLGDPAGIGPEIVCAAVVDTRVLDAARVVVVGPGRLRPRTVALVAQEDVESIEKVAWLDSGDVAEFELGRVQAATGEAALNALHLGHALALAHQVSALVTAPVSKEALHLAGEHVEGQTELLGRWCGVERFEMLAVAGSLRVLLVTRHMPLVAAIACLTTDRVLDRIELLDASLRTLGFGAPRIALAGLNPHAGENGLLGSEDGAILEPAVRRARSAGIDVHGPISPDTVFLLASRGQFDGVVALYHDQAFIPVKLLSENRGVTVIAGLPYLRVSPVHGTAFDIAGRGLASPENLIAAILQASEWIDGFEAGVARGAGR